MKKRFPQIVSMLLTFILLLSAAGCTQNPPPTEGPAIWMVTEKDSDTVLYLFGSIHVADESAYPLNDTIMAAYNESDYLAVEADVLAFQEDVPRQIELSKTMMYMDGGSITDDIDEKLVEQAIDILESRESDTELPAEVLKLMRPAGWNSVLSQAACDKVGLSEEYGIDMYFLERAPKDGKEILEVESVEMQLELLYGFPHEIQEYLFEDALDIDKNAEGTKALYDSWKTGNIEEYLQEEESSADELDDDIIQMNIEYNQKLVTDRNIGMADVAKSYMDDGKNVFFVVGALHMIGDDGIVELLKDSGYKVQRL